MSTQPNRQSRPQSEIPRFFGNAIILFERSERSTIDTRIDRLSSDALRPWGTMAASEMVCHVADQLRVAIGDIEVHPGPLRRIMSIDTFIYRSLIDKAA